MNQTVLGALLPFAVGLLVYAVRKGRVSTGFLVGLPVLMAIVAVWAIVPDIPRLIGMGELYHRLAHDPRTDIFLFHYTIDSMESDTVWGNAALVAMLAGLQAIALRILAMKERKPSP